ncbi:MAG: iron chelate uptake ABC transporter family permease subunit, partial [Desulfurococcales archaeon]|nr:iron chelate uptake ABC transporter family permease subunit [Desulfurococcales archaeon]
MALHEDFGSEGSSVRKYIIQRRRRFIYIFVFLLVTLIAASLTHLALGTIILNPMDVVLNGLRSSAGIYRFRLFRMIAAFLVGGLLSISGLLIQVCTRNPLGDPYLLGISSGALFTVTLTFLFPSHSLLAFIIKPAVAFIGGFLAYTLTHAIAVRAGYTPTSIVLSGVAVGTTLYSLSLLPQYLILYDIHKIFAWSMGSLIG